MPEHEDYIYRAEEALASARILYDNRMFNSAISEAILFYVLFCQSPAEFKELSSKKA